MGRNDKPEAAGAARQDRPIGSGLGEKMAHRALHAPSRREPPSMSRAARDRLYDRMFPSHICRGADRDDDADPLS